MSHFNAQPPVRIPRWLIWVGSIAIVFHLGAVGVNALAAPSGPWPDHEGLVYPPLLAVKFKDMIGADYLKTLRMAKVYHSQANILPASPEVRLEFRLKDEEGKLIRTVLLPDDEPNSWVRHRQALLTLVFDADQRVTPRQGQMIAAPGQQEAQIQIWENEKGQLVLRTVDENRVPLDRPVYKPTPWMLLLGRSYTRYICALHGAANAELIRHYREPIRPFVLTTEENLNPQAFNEIISNFGEFSR